MEALKLEVFMLAQKLNGHANIIRLRGVVLDAVLATVQRVFTPRGLLV